MKFRTFLFKNRVKPLAIAQLVLIIPIIMIFIMADLSSTFYISILQGILAANCLLLAIENFILKKRIFSFLYITFTIMFILLIMQTAHLINFKH